MRSQPLLSRTAGARSYDMRTVMAIAAFSFVAGFFVLAMLMEFPLRDVTCTKSSILQGSSRSSPAHVTRPKQSQKMGMPMQIQYEYLRQPGYEIPVQQLQIHELKSERPSLTRRQIQHPGQEMQRIWNVQSEIQIPRNEISPTEIQGPRVQFQTTIPVQGGATEKIQQKPMRQPDNAGTGSNGAGHFRFFLGLKFCNVGWSGTDCDKPLKKYKCNSRDDRCFYHPDYGTAIVSRKRWEGAQAVEQQRWKKELGDVDRNYGHKVSYDGYKPLPENLGDTVEIACGPFTQVKTILSSGHSVKSLTLLDPGAFYYMSNVQKTSYKKGQMQAPGVTTNTVYSFPAEKIPALTHMFDTVILINVIEHVINAFEVFENVYHMLRPGGLFIWHDRLWDSYKGIPGTKPEDGGILRDFLLHPIRLKSTFADRFTGLFETVYDVRDTPELRRTRFQGIYFIGRKKSQDGVRHHPPVPALLDEAKTTVVLMTHPKSIRQKELKENILRYYAMPVVKYIILILNGVAAPFDLQPYSSKLILKSFNVNSMNNRFRISREVMTESVLIVDDDMVLQKPLVECMVKHWILEKDRIFGLDAKATHNGEYRYVKQGEYSYVVGKTMLFHKKYLDLYLADKEIVQWVNPELPDGGGRLHFAEDLAMVSLVASITGKAPKVVLHGGLASEYDHKGKSLSAAAGWAETRYEFVKWLEVHFGKKSPTESKRAKCPA